MKLPEKKIQTLINRLTQCEVSFALYRLPWTDCCQLVLQTTSKAEELKSLEELNEKKGFVMAPFSITDQHPLVLIQPDITATDWCEIGKAISAFQEHIHIEPKSNVETNTHLSSEAEEKESYLEAFRDFMTPLGSKKYQKLVLSRTHEEPLDDDFSPLHTFVKAANLHSRMLVYLCHTPTTGTWIGSTPETLLSGSGDEWHTVALAGTMLFNEGKEQVKWSKKNQEEQSIVADYVRRAVKQFDRKFNEKEPYTARAGQLIHLKSDFYFTLKNRKMLGNILEELHPTPAVCGIPKKETFQFIQEKEKH
ncbi:MAG: chorismate-binding protein, partial [Phocaeicola sp.]